VQALAGSNPAYSAVRILRCVTPTAKGPLLLNMRNGHVRPTWGSLEGWEYNTSNDGGPQHSAGAQFADSIAVPGAAAVLQIRTGPAARRAELYSIRLAVNRGRPERSSAKSKPNHVNRWGNNGALRNPHARHYG
jgi:hypothetical protein